MDDCATISSYGRTQRWRQKCCIYHSCQAFISYSVAGRWMQYENEACQNHTGKGHSMYSEETLYQCYSVNHKSHIAWPGKENGPRWWKAGVGVSYVNTPKTRWWPNLFGAYWLSKPLPHSAGLPECMSSIKPKSEWCCAYPLNLDTDQIESGSLKMQQSQGHLYSIEFLYRQVYENACHTAWGQ